MDSDYTAAGILSTRTPIAARVSPGTTHAHDDDDDSDGDGLANEDVAHTELSEKVERLAAFHA